MPSVPALHLYPPKQRLSKLGVCNLHSGCRLLLCTEALPVCLYITAGCTVSSGVCGGLKERGMTNFEGSAFEMRVSVDEQALDLGRWPRVNIIGSCGVMRAPLGTRGAMCNLYAICMYASSVMVTWCACVGGFAGCVCHWKWWVQHCAMVVWWWCSRYHWHCCWKCT